MQFRSFLPFILHSYAYFPAQRRGRCNSADSFPLSSIPLLSSGTKTPPVQFRYLFLFVSLLCFSSHTNYRRCNSSVFFFSSPTPVLFFPHNTADEIPLLPQDSFNLHHRHHCISLKGFLNLYLIYACSFCSFDPVIQVAAWLGFPSLPLEHENRKLQNSAPQCSAQVRLSIGYYNVLVLPSSP